MNNFKIGKEINAIITNANISGLGTKVFPLIAPAKTTFPFCVYRRSFFRPSTNKDIENEIVGVEVIIAATKYEESVSIADAVADALTNAQSSSVIDELKITNVFEDWAEDTFLQHINCDIYIK